MWDFWGLTLAFLPVVQSRLRPSNLNTTTPVDVILGPAFENCAIQHSFSLSLPFSYMVSGPLC